MSLKLSFNTFFKGSNIPTNSRSRSRSAHRLRQTGAFRENNKDDGRSHGPLVCTAPYSLEPLSADATIERYLGLIPNALQLLFFLVVLTTALVLLHRSGG